MSFANYYDYEAGRAWASDCGAELAPQQHVQYGNVQEVSRWFSCSLILDSAAFWSMYVVEDGEPKYTRGRDWSSKRIACIDLDMCDILADLSTPALAAAHGLDDPRALRLAITNREVLLRAVPHNAILGMQTVEEICSSQGQVTEYRALMQRWVQYAQWASHSRFPSAFRPSWLPG